MNEIQKMLRDKKDEIDNLKVPDELEERLTNALRSVASRRKKRYSWMVKIAVLIIAITLVGHNMDTLGFYSRKIIGFDSVMTGTLKELNKFGKGQVIDKNYAFKNGISVTLDGVMIDDNQLIVFYTIKSPKGNVEEVNLDTSFIEGKKKTYYQKAGRGIANKEKTEIKWNYEFERPNFSEKELKWVIRLSDEHGREIERGEISFKLDKHKIMSHSLKKNLNKSIKIDQGEIGFKSIKASPTSTYIEGTIQNIFELKMKEFMGKGFRVLGKDIKLIANGKEVEWERGGSGTNINGETFKDKFDALPKDLKSLQIKLVSLETTNSFDKKIKLNKNQKNYNVEILGQNININEVYENGGKTYVTITTREDIRLTKVNMITCGQVIELKNTINGKREKNSNGSISYKRTLRFEGVGEDIELEVRGLSYNKVYNKIVDVPLK